MPHCWYVGEQQQLPSPTVEDQSTTAEDPISINYEASTRSHSADQRAAAVAAVASLAASLALTGATLVLDKDKLKEPTTIPLIHFTFESRSRFGAVLCLALIAFLIAAVLAVTAHQRQNDDIANEAKCASNWVAAKKKHARVTASLWFLVVGMGCVSILALLATLAPAPK
jgi:hypothetical protein